MLIAFIERLFPLELNFFSIIYGFILSPPPLLLSEDGLELSDTQSSRVSHIELPESSTWLFVLSFEYLLCYDKASCVLPSGPRFHTAGS